MKKGNGLFLMVKFNIICLGLNNKDICTPQFEFTAVVFVVFFFFYISLS